MFHLIKSKLQLASCLTLLLFSFGAPQVLAGDCLTSVWPVVFDSEAPNDSLYDWGQFRGECEYGVDFFPPSTAFMQMPIGHMIANADEDDGPFIFQMYVRPEQITGSQTGMIRVMELSATGPQAMSDVDVTSTLVMAVQFGWHRVNRSNLTNFFIRGVYNRPHSVFEETYEQSFMDPNIAQIPHEENNNGYFHIVLKWKPSTTRAAANGIVDIFVNNHHLVQQTGMRLSKEGPMVPNLVRYGAMNSLDREGTGTFRITPVNPSPFRPYITQ